MNLKISSNMDFRNAMNLFCVLWKCCLQGSFHLCIQHFEDALEWWIINDRKWLMALKDPMWDQVLKFGFIVCGSLHVDGNALGWINNLALTGLDVVNKVCCRIFLAFASQNDWGVSIASWDRMKMECRDLRVTNKLILYNIVLHNYNWCLEVAITSWGPVFDLGFYMGGARCQKNK